MGQSNKHSMKKTLLPLLSFLLIAQVELHAQFWENNALYASGNLDFGNYIGVNLGINYIYKEKYSFQLGASSHVRKPKSQPEDFSGGLASLFLAGPYDTFDNYRCSIGGIIPLNKKETMRLNMLVGAGYAIISEPINWDWEYLDQFRRQLYL